MIDKPVDLNSLDQSNLPQLNEIIAKICANAASIKYTDTLPTATDVGEGEIVIYDNNAGTMGAYVITQKKHLFGINDGANFFGLSNIPAGAGVIPAANLSATQVGLGSWTSKSVDTVYQAATDGFVVAVTNNHFHGPDSDPGNYAELLSDSSNPPTTVRSKTGTTSSTTEIWGFLCSPVKKNDYYKVSDNIDSTSLTVYFISLGS